ncbi:ribosome hibernation factor-recruiting GTPase MRF [Mycobacterium sp. LTG2003]
MRTPVVLVCGHGCSNGVAAALVQAAGTVVVSHMPDGHVLRRRVSKLRDSECYTSESVLELAGGCIDRAIRDDVLVLLRRLSRRADVRRIVLLLGPWAEPERICHAINHVPVHIGEGCPDGPAAGDVVISAVVTCIDTDVWMTHATSDEEVDDFRPVAQVVVGQVEFADVLVLTELDGVTLAVLRRLAPRCRIAWEPSQIESALRDLDAWSRRGADVDPHESLLAGQPPLTPDCDVSLVEFVAQRPFHPGRLHTGIDVLLDGVVRARGRIWLASQPDTVIWLESAGPTMRIADVGRWLAAMSAAELATVGAERQALAASHWDDEYGDRHVAMTVLCCGAIPEVVVETLNAALLTGDEFARPEDWCSYDDPFGDWREVPCDGLVGYDDEGGLRSRSDQERP